MASPICSSCGKEFERHKPNQKFCSASCRAAWHRLRHTRQAEHLSITAAAQEIGVCRHTVRRAIQRGKLRAVQVPTAGRPRMEVTRGELERYRAGRPARQRERKPGELDAAIRRAVDEMVERVQSIARQAFTPP